MNCEDSHIIFLFETHRRHQHPSAQVKNPAPSLLMTKGAWNDVARCMSAPVVRHVPTIVPGNCMLPENIQRPWPIFGSGFCFTIDKKVGRTVQNSIRDEREKNSHRNSDEDDQPVQLSHSAKEVIRPERRTMPVVGLHE